MVLRDTPPRFCPYCGAGGYAVSAVEDSAEFFDYGQDSAWYAECPDCGWEGAITAIIHDAAYLRDEN